MKPLVSVLILTYNRPDLLKNCLKSALASTYPNLQFVVSDNGQLSSTEEIIKKEFPRARVKVVSAGKNVGLTGGFNFGFKYCKGKYVMLLSNDTKLEKNSISNMVEMFEKDKEIGVVAPKIIQMRNKKYLHSVGSFFTYTGILYHYGLSKKVDNKRYQDPYYTFSANGSGFMIRRDIVKKTGLFEQEFFVAYDESDLCHRVWLAGYTVVYCPTASLQHLWGATLGGTEKEENPKVWFLNDRNKISSFLINLSLPNAIIVLTVFNIILVVWFFVNIARGRVKTAMMLPQAYKWHLQNYHKNMKKRKHVQNRIRKVSDSEIFRRCMVNPDIYYYYVLYKFGVIDGLKKYTDKKLPARILYNLQ